MKVYFMDTFQKQQVTPTSILYHVYTLRQFLYHATCQYPS
jgi:hypothetical protein